MERDETYRALVVAEALPGYGQSRRYFGPFESNAEAAAYIQQLLSGDISDPFTRSYHITQIKVVG